MNGFACCIDRLLRCGFAVAAHSCSAVLHVQRLQLCSVHVSDTSTASQRSSGMCGFSCCNRARCCSEPTGAEARNSFSAVPVVRCMDYVARCMLYVVRYTLHGLRCTLHGLCCTLHAVRDTVFVAWNTLHVAWCMFACRSGDQDIGDTRSIWQCQNGEAVNTDCAVRPQAPARLGSARPWTESVQCSAVQCASASVALRWFQSLTAERQQH